MKARKTSFHRLALTGAVFLFFVLGISMAGTAMEQQAAPVIHRLSEDDLFLISDPDPSDSYERPVEMAPNKTAAPVEDSVLSRQVDRIHSCLSLQEKVAQLFIITPEALTQVNGVTMAGEVTRAAFADYPVGGIIYMEPNIQTWEQTSQMLSSMQEISMERIGLPAFLCVDEEGGSVRRVSGRLENVPYIPEMSSLGRSGDLLQAYQTGSTIGEYLNSLGFNVDFAPVADVLTNPANTVIGSRAFSSDPQITADLVSMEVAGLKEEGICATLKHFPGHGNTSEDSHLGLAVSYKTLEELRQCELIPFEAGIESGADFIMVGHIAMPNITGSDVPSSLSDRMMAQILREDLGFEGIILTDAMNMGAIVNTYGSGEAAVKAFLAGADMILAPGDFQSACYSILAAVEDGRISRERLDESLRRIIGRKLMIQNNTS